MDSGLVSEGGRLVEKEVLLSFTTMVVSRQETTYEDLPLSPYVGIVLAEDSFTNDITLTH